MKGHRLPHNQIQASRAISDRQILEGDIILYRPAARSLMETPEEAI